MVDSADHKSIIWDNHACMPLRVDDTSFLPELSRVRAAGVDVISLNVGMDPETNAPPLSVLASMARWIGARPQEYVLAQTVADLHAAKRDGKLAILFDMEGGRAVETHLSLIEAYYNLGVRWMLIAYNKNNKLGGGCQDEDTGLTDYGRQVIREMERVGMVLCCSHTGYRTAHEAIEFSNNPVIFSHSNARAIADKERNVPDDLIVACAKTGGVMGINGFGIWLGGEDNLLDRIVAHIDHISGLVGPQHVGLGLDYVFDQQEMDDYVQSHPEIFPAEKGYKVGMAMTPPEAIPDIAEALDKRGYSKTDIAGVMGMNFLRIAEQVWK